MRTAEEVLDIALNLMAENDDDGSTMTEDTEEYQYRAPQLLNALVAEYKLYTGGKKTIVPIESLADGIIGVDDVYATAVLPYGLATKLILEEDPSRARFFHEKYEEARDLYTSRVTAEIAPIEDVYGGVEYGAFGAW